jgi:hypothetical protein
MISGVRTIFPMALGAILLTISAATLPAQNTAGKRMDSTLPAGVWIGAAQFSGQDVPFHLEIAGSADHVQGTLINGKEKSSASSGSYSDGHLVLQFNYYTNTLDATLEDGTLKGTFSGRGRSVPITAQLNGKLPVAAPNPPRIGGIWQVAIDNGAKGERSWNLRVRQTGANVQAVIERIDGDTGSLYGVWRDGAFTVSHFTAAGPSLAVLRPQPDGSLHVETSAHAGATQTFAAHRVSALRTVSVESADDPLHHTSLKNPDEPLAFRFPISTAT